MKDVEVLKRMKKAVFKTTGKELNDDEVFDLYKELQNLGGKFE